MLESEGRQTERQGLIGTFGAKADGEEGSGVQGRRTDAMWVANVLGGSTRS